MHTLQNSNNNHNNNNTICLMMLCLVPVCLSVFVSEFENWLDKPANVTNRITNKNNGLMSVFLVLLRYRIQNNSSTAYRQQQLRSFRMSMMLVLMLFHFFLCYYYYIPNSLFRMIKCWDGTAFQNQKLKFVRHSKGEINELENRMWRKCLISIERP